MRAHGLFALGAIAICWTTGVADAQEQSPADASAPPQTPPPPETPTPPPTETPTPPPTVAPAPTPLLPQPSAAVPAQDDPGPERLAAVIGVAAAAQRRSRIVDGVIGALLSGGAIASGAVLLTLPNQTDATRAFGYIAIGFGGAGALSSGLGLFSPGALERLDAVYGPIARDHSIPAEARLEQGETALRQMADGGRRGRILGGIVSIVVGVGLGIAAIPLVLTVPDSDPDASTKRVYFGLAFGVSSFAGIASGVTSIVVRRTEAEQLWSMWLAGTGRSEARVRPFVTPIVGGVVTGLGGRF